jgi:hypothetical protein
LNTDRGKRVASLVGLLLLAIGAHAVDHVRDMGPIPTSGVDAFNTVPNRDKRVIRELACGSEARFIDELRAASGDRPIGHAIAKAAVLAGMLDQELRCQITQLFDSRDWDASQEILADKHPTPAALGTVSTVFVDASWPALKEKITQLNADYDTLGVTPAPERATDNANEIARLLNRLEMDTFGQQCDSVASVTAIVHPKTAEWAGWVEYRVTYTLSPDCLERQINHVILARDVGRGDNNPGSSGLPCHLIGSAPHGDWDMAVTNFTRLTFLLRTAGTLRQMSSESGETMSKLQSRLLTLSGGPAAEVHPVWGCGNPDNQYGSARDRLDDNDYYDPDLQKDVEGDGEGDSFWDDLLGILLLALALLLIGLALAAIAAILAALFGPAIAALVMAILAVIAVIEDVPQLIAGAIAGGIEETENHLFMQNSAKYLKNEMLMEECDALGDSDCTEDYQDYNDELRGWFVKRVHGVARNDFAEFNAKPYGRLSFIALLNARDFACSAHGCAPEEVRLGTGIDAIFDLTATKMALGSNQGRRMAPFRRLAHTNTSYTIGRLQKDGTRSAPYRFFDVFGDADHWVAAMQVHTGATFHGPEGHASDRSLGEMLYEATSSYRPRALILDIALDKSTKYQQTYHHAGWERYSSGPGWLLTAGGTESGYAQGFRTPLGTIYPEQFIKWSDRGAGVPTSLMVSAGHIDPDPCRRLQEECNAGPLPVPRVIQPQRQDTYTDFVRFEGKIVHWKKEPDDQDEPLSYNDNFCVFGSFACGINLKIPDFLEKEKCLQASGGITSPSTRVFQVIDSSTCKPWYDANAANDFYAIIYRQPCKQNSDCPTGSNWGFVEVVEKSVYPSVASLQADVLAKNAASFDVIGKSGGKGAMTYNSISNGVIKFDPQGSYVTEVNGVAQPHGNAPGWPRAAGGVVSEVSAGHYKITSPRTMQSIDIDFTDPENPKRD